ncbi:hypothetical protein KAR91_00515 [Candidatus Pacearchaeota archaeon]|nr:hypothetical protein [Candidatus Pacearchaeota archaeon]
MSSLLERLPKNISVKNRIPSRIAYQHKIHGELLTYWLRIEKTGDDDEPYMAAYIGGNGKDEFCGNVSWFHKGKTLGEALTSLEKWLYEYGFIEDD